MDLTGTRFGLDLIVTDHFKCLNILNRWTEVHKIIIATIKLNNAIAWCSANKSGPWNSLSFHLKIKNN